MDSIKERIKRATKFAKILYIFNITSLTELNFSVHCLLADVKRVFLPAEAQLPHLIHLYTIAELS